MTTVKQIVFLTPWRIQGFSNREATSFVLGHTPPRLLLSYECRGSVTCSWTHQSLIKYTPVWRFRTSLWKACCCIHEKSRRYDLAWSQPENVSVAFHSLGHGVRQMIPSGLRPVELLQECRGFVTRHNLVILCPSVTGLLLQREEVLLLHCSITCCSPSLCCLAPGSYFSGSSVWTLGLLRI